MHPTQEELVERIVGALELLDRCDPATDPLFSYLYKPHPELPNMVLRLEAYAAKDRPSKLEREAAGRLMEQIAAASFSQLKGVTDIESYQSAAAQYDLLASGDTLSWSTLSKKLYMREDRRSILIEAKARQSKLTDKEFSRLIGILESHLSVAGLGVFFTIRGATGFPKFGVAQRTLRDCQLRQALYYAKTERPIVVLDLKDIATLTNTGALPSLIARKVRALSGLSGQYVEPVSPPVRTGLPPHLATFSPSKGG